MQHIFISSQLSLAQLTSLISQFYPDWQPCFLNNDDNPVLGILPKTSWTLYYQNNQLISHQKTRKDFQIISKNHKTAYQQWIKHIIQYQKNYSYNSDLNNDYYTQKMMGFISYDVSANALNHHISIKDNQPCAYLGHYDIYFEYKNKELILTYHNNNSSFINKLYKMILKIINNHIDFNITPTCQFTQTWNKDNYQTAFNQIQHYLKAGDAYQINLTQKWQGVLKNKLFYYLPKIIKQINAPFSGYLLIDDFELLSISPELFFTFKKENNHNTIITKPIKGTRPRNHDIIQDEILKNELKNSPKDISENLMIVDLLRNDLGKYAKIGSVKVPKSFDIESFYNVHHMVSTITATLKDNINSFEVLFDSLPAGSITGAPKKRACEIIYELESDNRGAYCGTMGYMNFDGTGKWNVLIRTLQSKNNIINLWAGGGITLASKLDEEYQECFDKIMAIIAIFNSK